MLAANGRILHNMLLLIPMCWMLPRQRTHAWCLVNGHLVSAEEEQSVLKA